MGPRSCDGRMSNYDEVLVWVEWQPSEATVC